MDPYIGTIAIFAFNFAPTGWLLCNGQLLSISQNTALFSLLGTTYGGDGRVNFGIPNLQGRVPMHFGQGPGLSNYILGQAGGEETTTLLINNMPEHHHSLNAVSDAGDTAVPAGAFLGNTGALDREYKISGSGVVMNQNAIGNTGGSQPLNTLQPYLVVNYCIAFQGIYPSRS